MARWLKQSTSVDVPIGPFVDSTDGVTAETALTITQPDIRLKKNGGAWAQKNAAQTLSHEEAGYYEVTLDATDTNTLGLLRLAVAESGALPVWEDFIVLPANVYDSLVGGSDTLDVQVTGIGANVITATSIAADAITDAKVASDVTIASVTGAVGSVTGAVGSVTGAVGSVASGGISEASFATTAGSFAPLGIIDQGTAQSATGTTLVLRAAAAFADDQIIGATIVITGGSAGVGQAREITDYVSSTDTATVDTWTTTPTGTITYKIFAGPPAPATPPAVNVTQVIGDPIITSSSKTTNWGGT